MERYTCTDRKLDPIVSRGTIDSLQRMKPDALARNDSPQTAPSVFSAPVIVARMTPRLASPSSVPAQNKCALFYLPLVVVVVVQS
jgi:hypothetical protein